VLIHSTNPIVPYQLSSGLQSIRELFTNGLQSDRILQAGSIREIISVHYSRASEILIRIIHPPTDSSDY
jgi:hypothetical protein